VPFKPEPSLTWIQATREQVVAVVESINQPQVSIPGKTSQQVFGHLAGVRNANNTFSIYVGLHLPRTGENVVYVHERRQLAVEEYRDVEAEGLNFLESMGFMLDNVNYRNLAPEAQEQTFGRVPLFTRPRPVPRASAADTRTSPRAALARLLAGF
jgi:hypothetical protein